MGTRRPVPNADQGALPGLSIAEQCIEKIRSLFNPAASQESAPPVWLALDEKGRRFLCRVADIEPARAALPWVYVPPDERRAILGAWARLRAWVKATEDSLGSPAAR